ncbi:MAG: response regulator [Hyphomicrobium sp.]|uniref:response regulator n=1 Tax=Hyphomicrobium sp. TaxID=82 RepID=UPI0039E4BD7F
MAVDCARPAFEDHSRPLIVVIEDDYRSSMALTMLIDDWGYSCVAARSSREAVRTLGHSLGNIAAIITDIEIDGQMRGVRDALAIAAAIGHSIPTIITTGHADYSSGALPFPVVRKPFDPDILRRWLRYRVGAVVA